MCLHGALCSISFNLIWNMTTFRKKKKEYILTSDPTPGFEGVCNDKKNVLACCRIRDSIYLDMQHDHILKRLNFYRSTPPLGSGRGSAVKICATMLLHVTFPLS